MATLRRLSDGTRTPLAQDSLVGRSPDALVRLDSPRASSRHASLSWSRRGWELRDLGSRNVTLVRGKRVEASSPRLLRAGDEVVFAEGAEAWCFECDQPPLPAARRLGSQELVQLEEGYLGLPSAAEPEVTIYEHPSLGWLLEDQDGELSSVHHEQVLTVAGQAWRLHLVESQSTLAMQAPRSLLAGAALRFLVSPDEEHVEIELRWPEDLLELPPSVHWYIPLLLARARDRDRRAAALPEREQGWVYRDELCEQLRTTPQKLNVDIHRMRRLLARAGITDGASLIERRASTGQLRLGVARFRLD